MSFYFLILASFFCLMICSCADDEVLDKKVLTKIGPPSDLIIESYFTDIQFNSTLCTDTMMLTTHCDFGDAARIFNASVRIRNVGTGALPTGTIEVQWNDLTTGGISFTTVSHGGLPPQASIVASRPYFVGPCDCVQNPSSDGNCFIHSYNAYVDPANLISESNEVNNGSEILDTCDGCGPCGEVPVNKEL